MSNRLACHNMTPNNFFGVHSNKIQLICSKLTISILIVPLDYASASSPSSIHEHLCCLCNTTILYDNLNIMLCNSKIVRFCMKEKRFLIEEKIRNSFRITLPN